MYASERLVFFVCFMTWAGGFFSYSFLHLLKTERVDRADVMRMNCMKTMRQASMPDDVGCCCCCCSCYKADQRKDRRSNDQRNDRNRSETRRQWSQHTKRMNRLATDGRTMNWWWEKESSSAAPAAAASRLPSHSVGVWSTMCPSCNASV